MFLEFVSGLESTQLLLNVVGLLLRSRRKLDQNYRSGSRCFVCFCRYREPFRWLETAWALFFAALGVDGYVLGETSDFANDSRSFQVFWGL